MLMVCRSMVGIIQRSTTDAFSTLGPLLFDFFFTNTRITAQQLPQSTNDENLVRVVLPFKDQRSADMVRNWLKDLSCKTSVTIQLVFVSQKINELLKIREKKPSIVNQQRVFTSLNVTCVIQVITSVIQWDTSMSGLKNINTTNLPFVNITCQNIELSQGI